MNPLWKSAAVALVIIGIATPFSFFQATSAHQMSRFTSYDELMSFIQAKPSACPGTSITPLVQNPRFGPSTFQGQKSTLAVDHSSTNVQVQGVDELDSVKSDGQYIYTITNNTLVIVKAYPVSEATVVSRIIPNETLTGVFVLGNKLVLIGGEGGYGPFLSGRPILGMASGEMRVSYFNPITRLWVYDISSLSNPVLTLTLKQTGSYEGSRLISNFVYLITTENLFVQNNRVNLPSRAVNGQNSTVPPTEIYHSDIPDYYYSLTSVARLDLNGPSKLTSETFLIGTSSTIYASTGNIYLTSATWACNQATVIHRVSISNGNVNYETTGTVPGHILNQFSMDETNGYFRVATSNYGSTPVGAMQPATIVQPMQPAPIVQPVQQTNLYVLDSSLHIVGKLEGLSPGEAFYAARFMGDRAYLVTFQRIDPLFVIGLQDPHHPRVLGQLNITGVSDYLQPYDETHLIGFGKSSMNMTWENAALFQGLKLSLFDVTDPSHPVDTSNYLVGDRGSDSPALTDHRSVLFEHSLNLLVIPLEIAKAQQNTTYPWAYNSVVWQGAYVFSVTLENGIVFRGGITHLSNGQTPSWNNTNRFITTSLYIGSVLYTLSPVMVKMNSLVDLSELGTVTL